MTLTGKLAFFAPIKPPDHPIPSGDRLIAQNLIKALEIGGHQVMLASRYICYSKRSDPAILAERKAGALAEASRFINERKALPNSEQVDAWITYHPYCKAPDWIGPLVSCELNIPYVTIEAARTGQGDDTDPWRPWREEAQAGIRKADLHLVFKPSDRAYLTELLGSTERLRDFPTFVDLQTLIGEDAFHLPSHWSDETPVIITTGMMRKGKKDQNFYMLAEILSGMVDQDWNLIVVGGGPEEDAIRVAFGNIPAERVHWTGQVSHDEVLKWMRAADIFMWPGWKEPIGMVYLEAQAQGLPVIAYESMGVPLVVDHEVSGLLAPEGDDVTMQANIRCLLEDKAQRTKMGEAAKAKVRNIHSIEAASERLSAVMKEVSGGQGS